MVKQLQLCNERMEIGKGNVKGVIGPEGANNSQKATSMITTMLFGEKRMRRCSWHYLLI